MNRLIAALILGFVSFFFTITGPLSLLLSIPGLILAFSSLKLPEKELTLPFGYKGNFAGKTIKARPYFSTKYLTFAAIGVNAFSIVIALLATLPILFLFLASQK